MSYVLVGYMCFLIGAWVGVQLMTAPIVDEEIERPDVRLVRAFAEDPSSAPTLSKVAGIEPAVGLPPEHVDQVVKSIAERVKRGEGRASVPVRYL